ncbi:hypothetical protein [Sphingomonas sp. PWP1-2]|jgi:tetratricopeptide (TPR) repeat protein|uniref:hypothetical protein n=1 Tax=Sphingomonas sp. PWP1-2 TaxID=2804558 RepID=UPI003CF105F8
MPIAKHFAAWLLLTAASTTPVVAASDTAPIARDAQLPGWVEAAESAIIAKDCAKALRLIDVGIAAPASATLPPSVRAAVLEAGVTCALQTRQSALAYRFVLDATRFDEASDWIWRTRLALELDAKTPDAALATVVAMTQGRGGALNSAPAQWMFALSHQLRDRGGLAARRRLLAILTTPSYQPQTAVPVIDPFRRDYAGLLYEAGEKDAALAQIRQIENSSMLLMLSVDPRFRQALGPDFAPRAAVERFLATLRTAALLHPDSLEVVIEIAARERELGRGDAALGTLQAAAPLGPKASSYTDIDEQLNWWWDGVGRTHQALGHFDAAAVAFGQGKATAEHGSLNVSQTINLAWAQLRSGHSSDALATLAVFDVPGRDVSAYGLMEMRSVQACAAAQLGKTVDASVAIAFVKAHRRENIGALGDVLLCTGDFDGAAAEFIQRLDDPEQRATVLLMLSDYDPPVGTLPPDPIYSRLPALERRADMKAAIARAGGTRRIPLQREPI